MSAETRPSHDDLTDVALTTAGVRPRNAGPRVGDFVGRYAVVGSIGAGGMGVVVRAYDPKLRREVALKTLHHDLLGEAAWARLRREAQAMAQLAHPNVVAVYDIHEDDQGKVVLAMEYVEGQSMDRWLQTSSPWEDVLAALVQAGRGLAAAHGAGLIHRDFKPSNVLIGEDGRARVTDFGIVRVSAGSLSSCEAEAEAEDELPSGPSRVAMAEEPAEVELTKAAAVLGTPLYMAPEQHSGATADTAADQFAFCVSAWQALVGTPPYQGTPWELAAAKLEPPPRWPRTSPTPRHIGEAIRRGLSPSPRDRWPSMDALLDALAYDPRRRQRRGLQAGLALGLVGVSAAGWLAGRDPKCTGAKDVLAEVWNDDVRRRAGDAVLATQVTYAATTWPKVEARLEAYGNAWVEGHTDACEATNVRSEQSDELLDLRMVCLGRAHDALEQTVALLLEADAGVVEHAVSMVDGLPSLSHCADVIRLRAEVPPPDDPADALAAQSIRQRLASAGSLDDAGRYDQANVLLQELEAEARALGHPPVLARVMLERGVNLEQRSEFVQATAMLEQALELALEHGVLDVATGSANSLTFVLAARRQRADEARLSGGVALALARRLEAGGAHEVSALKNLALAHAAANEFNRAIETDQQALELLEPIPNGSELLRAQVLNDLGNFLRSSGDFERAVPFQREALSVYEDNLGSDHPSVGRLIQNVGNGYFERGELEQAREHYERAHAILESALGPEHVAVSDALNNLGSAWYELGDPARASEHWDRALAIRERALDPDHPAIASTLSNMAVAYEQLGQLEEAEALHRRVLAIWDRRTEHGSPEELRARLSLVGLLVRMDRSDDALASLRQTLAFAEEHLDDPKRFARATNDIGNYLTKLGHPDEAEALHRQALPVLRAAHGDLDATVGTACNNLGWALIELGRHAEAREQLLPALRSFEASLASDDPNLITVIINLGDVEVALGRDPAALEYYERALEIMRGRGAPAVNRFTVTLSVARLRWALGERASAHALVLELGRDLEQAGELHDARQVQLEAWLAEHRLHSG